MIVQDFSGSFGSKVTRIKAPSVNAVVTTAKQSTYGALSTRVGVRRAWTPFSSPLIEYAYPAGTSEQTIHSIHDRLASALDTELSRGATIVDAIRTAHKPLLRQLTIIGTHGSGSVLAEDH